MITVPQIVNIETEDLKTDGKNPNQMQASKFIALKKNLERFGFIVPIITNKDLVVADGEHRLKAAKSLGMETVPVIRLDIDEVDRKILRQVMNKLRGEHDLQLDLEEFKFLEENDGLGVLAELMAEDEYKFLNEDINVEEDEFTEPKVAKYDVKEGEVWQLGDHRLMCGDSTDYALVDSFIPKNKINLLFTDPPYNIDYQTMDKAFDKIKNDKMSEEDFQKFTEKWLSCSFTTRGYVCCNWKYYHIFYKALENKQLPVKSCIVWDKERGVQNLDKYHKQHEFILYFGEFGGERTLSGDIFRLSRQKSDLHPTMKPIELCSKFIVDSSKAGESVLDLFGGSGSTLIACEQTGRKCYMMELDPHYCSVIIERWEALTGKEAVNLNGEPS